MKLRIGPYGSRFQAIAFNEGICAMLRKAGHVARLGREEACTGFWWGNLWERDHLEDPGVDRRKILSWIFRK